MGDAYVRVYYRVIDDERFVGIYSDDHHLATWLRLLLMADAQWPASCPVPRTIRKASLAALVEAGLVELTKNDHFRIHGLDSERNARSSKARDAADMRWHSGSNAGALPTHSEVASVGNAQPMPSRAEPSVVTTVRATTQPEGIQPPKNDGAEGPAPARARTAAVNPVKGSGV